MPDYETTEYYNDTGDIIDLMAETGIACQAESWPDGFFSQDDEGV